MEMAFPESQSWYIRDKQCGNIINKKSGAPPQLGCCSTLHISTSIPLVQHYQNWPLSRNHCIAQKQGGSMSHFSLRMKSRIYEKQDLTLLSTKESCGLFFLCPMATKEVVPDLCPCIQARAWSAVLPGRTCCSSAQKKMTATELSWELQMTFPPSSFMLTQAWAECLMPVHTATSA